MIAAVNIRGEGNMGKYWLICIKSNKRLSTSNTLGCTYLISKVEFHACSITIEVVLITSACVSVITKVDTRRVILTVGSVTWVVTMSSIAEQSVVTFASVTISIRSTSRSFVAVVHFSVQTLVHH